MSETYRIVIADDEAFICMDLKEILPQHVWTKFQELVSESTNRSDTQLYPARADG